MPSIRQDLTFALRGLRRRPGYASVAVLTIAIAVAGNTAIFSVVNGVLLEPLPFHEPDELVTLDVRSTQGFSISTSIPNYRDWGERSRVFTSYGAAAGWGFTLTGAGEAEVLGARAVLGDFFGTLGLTPFLGRVLSPPETEPGNAPLVVLGYGIWQSKFGADPDVVGRAITLDERPHTIVGVLSPEIGYPSATTDIYVNMGSIPRLPWEDRGSSFGTRSFARLKPGVALAAAQADLDRVHREVEELEGEPQARPEVRSLNDLFLGDVRAQLWILMGAVGFVLLIAAANVANLQLARGEDRRREIAVRTALGARRGVLMRELLSESVVLALVGGAFGLPLSFVAVRILVPLLPVGIPSSVEGRIAIDGSVLGFTFAAAAITGLLVGLLPAIRGSAVALSDVLKAGGRGTSAGRQRLRASLVVAEVALSLVLLIGAGLMIKSLGELQRVDKGFEADGILTARIGIARENYPTLEAERGFFRTLLGRAQALPGVRSATLTLMMPLSNRSWEMGVLPEGRSADEERHSFLFGIVTEDYFETLGIPLLQGRSFTSADRDGGALVAIVDETMAERFWPGEDPIGKRVFFEVDGGDDHGVGGTPVYRTVVGVAQNVRHYELQSPSRIQLYVPFDQTRLIRTGNYYIALKTNVAPTSVVTPLRQELAALDPNVPLTGVRALQEYVDDELSSSRAMGGLLATFAGVALLLAGVGIFGVMSYSVVQRTKEIGIRMALGADAGNVLRWISGQGLVLSGGGIALGLVAAAGLTRLLVSFLYEVSPIEPAIYGGLAVVLLGIAMLAAYLPARRATRVDPVEVLAEE